MDEKFIDIQAELAVELERCGWPASAIDKVVWAVQIEPEDAPQVFDWNTHKRTAFGEKMKKDVDRRVSALREQFAE